MINRVKIGQLFALICISGAASAALPPVVNGNGQIVGTSAHSSSMLNMYNRLEQLQREVQQMRGQIEEQTYLIETLKKRQRDLYLDTDRRIVQLESGKRVSPVMGSRAPTPPVNPVQPSQQANAVQAVANQDKLAYDKAFSSLKSGRYQQAIIDFSAFSSTFPSSMYLPNALYWLGEASYVNRDFSRALAEFNKVIVDYATHSKAKDAMLKIGFIQYENKQWKEARQTLQNVVSAFPGTTVSGLAQKRLDRMRQEKH